jgi:hypothetical protein
MRAGLFCFTTVATMMFCGFAWGAGDAVEEEPVATDPEQEIQAALKELPEDDRPLASAQRWCAVEQEHRLGSMGCPVKVILDGKPVFLCCAGCVKRAKSHAKATIANAATMTRGLAKAIVAMPNRKSSARSRTRFALVRRACPQR